MQLIWMSREFDKTSLKQKKKKTTSVKKVVKVVSSLPRTPSPIPASSSALAGLSEITRLKTTLYSKSAKWKSTLVLWILTAYSLKDGHWDHVGTANEEAVIKSVVFIKRPWISGLFSSIEMTNKPDQWKLQRDGETRGRARTGAPPSHPFPNGKLAPTER